MLFAQVRKINIPKKSSPVTLTFLRSSNFMQKKNNKKANELILRNQLRSENWEERDI